MNCKVVQGSKGGARQSSVATGGELPQGVSHTSMNTGRAPDRPALSRCTAPMEGWAAAHQNRCDHHSMRQRRFDAGSDAGFVAMRVRL